MLDIKERQDNTRPKGYLDKDEIAQYSPIEIVHTLDVEKLRMSLIQRLKELRGFWKKVESWEPDLEIDKKRSLGLKGVVGDLGVGGGSYLDLYITNNSTKPRRYYVDGFATCYHLFKFDENDSPVSMSEWDSEKMKKDGVRFDQKDRYKKPEINFETATGEELLKIADILKMYSEPYEYFGVGAEDEDDKSGQIEDETKPMKKGTRRLPLPRGTRALLQGK